MYFLQKRFYCVESKVAPWQRGSMESPKSSFPNPEISWIAASSHQLVWISDYIRSLHIAATTKQLSWLCPILLVVIFLPYASV